MKGLAGVHSSLSTRGKIGIKADENNKALDLKLWGSDDGTILIAVELLDVYVPEEYPPFMYTAHNGVRYVVNPGEKKTLCFPFTPGEKFVEIDIELDDGTDVGGLKIEVD